MPAFFKAARRSPRASGAPSLATGARCALVSRSILAGSMNSSALPLAGTMANASATGLWATSEPRMLKSQQIEGGKVRTTASWPSFFRVAWTSASLSSADLPAYLRGCTTTAPCGGAGRCLAPDAGPRDCGERLQLDAPRGQLLGQVVDAARRVQLGVEADGGAGLQRLGQPLAHLRLADLQHLEHLGVHLPRRLQDVAAIDEQRGAVLGDDGRPRRSGEARHERQPFGARGQVLVGVLVGVRDQQRVDARAGHQLAQALDALAARSAALAGLVGLEHGPAVGCMRSLVQHAATSRLGRASAKTQHKRGSSPYMCWVCPRFRRG